MHQSGLQDWIASVSEKIRNPTSSVRCSNCGQGDLDVAFLEVDGEFFEAHVCCEACGKEAWIRKPQISPNVPREDLRRYSSTERPHGAAESG